MLLTGVALRRFLRLNTMIPTVGRSGLFLRPDEVPTIEAVFAAVGHDLPGLPPVVRLERDEVAGPETVDADDRLGRRRDAHTDSSIGVDGAFGIDRRIV